MRCFVTVGSTQFDELIDVVLSDECLGALKHLGVTELVLQTGAGKYKEDELSRADISIKIFRYKSNITDEMANANLIIGHAGAGTCLEALNLQKSLVVVINEQLMDNHQRELADRLAELGHVVSTTPEKLTKCLREFDFTTLKPFAQPDYKFVAAEIDKLMGFDDDDSSR